MYLNLQVAISFNEAIVNRVLNVFKQKVFLFVYHQ